VVRSRLGDTSSAPKDEAGIVRAQRLLNIAMDGGVDGEQSQADNGEPCLPTIRYPPEWELFSA